MISHRNRFENSLPVIKVTLGQGVIIGKLLCVTGKKPVRAVSKVIEEMKQEYKEDYLRRGGHWPAEPQRQQKRIDTEHSVIVEFCKSFDLISYQGKEVMLTFLGRKLLKTMQEHGADSVFDSVLSDCLGKIILFVDDKKWGITHSLKNAPDGVTNLSLLRILNQKDVGVDISSLQRRLKSQLREKFRQEWKSKYGGRPVDWVWMENKIKKELRSRTQERLSLIMESVLKLLRHVGVAVKNGVLWYVDKMRLDSLQTIMYWRDLKTINHEEFFSAISESYRVWIMKMGASDVPIPLIRNDVCWKLNIPWDFFDSLAQDAPLEYKGIVLSFGQSRFPKKWGIVKNSRNLYYLRVQLKKGD